MLLLAPPVMAGFPVVETYTSNNSGGDIADSVRLGKPTGVETGDLLLIIVGNDNTTPANFSTITGWTRFVHHGDGTSDCNIVCYWRIADGSESDTTQVDAYSPHEIWGWYIRVSGTNRQKPIDHSGAAYVVGSGDSHDILQATSTVDSCLILYALSFDGGDGYPFSVSGTGWSEEAEQQSGSGNQDACGVWGTKEMASAGGAGTATVTSSIIDGAAAIQFAVASFKSVDTLSDTSEVYDAFLVGYDACDPEEVGEDCHRYNTGATMFGYVGRQSLDEQRMVLSFPGWTGVMPDSSELQLYCNYEANATDHIVAAYPLTAEFIEGTELGNAGGYPDPDSGVTWNHRYLDDGDADSLDWSSAGGDYTTAIACSVTITASGQYFSLRNFNRILNYMDTSGTYYGVLLQLITTPAFNNGKRFRASETDYSTPPLLITYSTAPVDSAVGQVIMIQ